MKARVSVFERQGLTLGVAALVTTLSSSALADDWPQWRGPQRNGLSRERGWLTRWPEGSPLPTAWQTAVGKGHSAPSISRGRVFILGWDGRRDTLFCLAEETGKLLWKQSYPCATLVQWPGPRATPTVEGDAVYTLGQHGQLNAWECATGRKLWSLALPRAYQPDDDYGFAWSPLIQGDLLLLACGKRGWAVHKHDGKAAWGHDLHPGACASPVPFAVGQQRGVLLLILEAGRNRVGLVGVDPASGRELWTRPFWPEKWGAIGTDPVAHEGRFFITSAEQHKRCARFSWKGETLVQDWANAHLSCYTSGILLWKDHLYGVDKTGLLKCVDWNTGEERWAQRGFGERGSAILADGRLLIQTGHTGELCVVEATPSGYRELRRQKVFPSDPATFTAPVLANGRIFCRSYAGQLVCLSLRGP